MDGIRKPQSCWAIVHLLNVAVDVLHLSEMIWALSGCLESLTDGVFTFLFNTQ